MVEPRSETSGDARGSGRESASQSFVQKESPAERDLPGDPAERPPDISVDDLRKRLVRCAAALSPVVAACLVGGAVLAPPSAAASATLETPRAAIAPTFIPRPPRLRLPAPKFRPKPPRIALRPVPVLPIIARRPWRTLVRDLPAAQYLGTVRVGGRVYFRMLVDVDDARKALQGLYRRDRYKKLMVDAMCTAMEWLRRQGPPDLTFSTDAWRSWFAGYLDYYWRSHLDRYSKPYARQVVDGWAEQWKMAEVNPLLAFGYFSACLNW